MTTIPAQPQPRNTLTWLAIASFLVGLALTGFFVYRIVQTAPSSPQPAGGPVELKKEGLTIYSSARVDQVPCTVKNSRAGEVVLSRIRGSETITVNNSTWHVVARSADPVPAGTYQVVCADDSTVNYAVGPRSTVTGFVGSIFGAIGSLVVFTVLGVVLLTISLVERRRSKQDRPAWAG